MPLGALVCDDCHQRDDQVPFRLHIGRNFEALGLNGGGGHASTPTRRAIVKVNTNAATRNNISLSFLKRIGHGWQRVHFAVSCAQENRMALALFLFDEIAQVDPAAVCDNGDLFHFGGAFIAHGLLLCSVLLGQSSAAQLVWLGAAVHILDNGVSIADSSGLSMVPPSRNNYRKTDFRGCRGVPCSSRRLLLGRGVMLAAKWTMIFFPFVPVKRQKCTSAVSSFCHGILN